MFPGQCGNTAFFFKSQPDQFHFEFRGIVFPGKSFFSAHEVSTCKISGCLSYRILDSGPDGTQTTLTTEPPETVFIRRDGRNVPRSSCRVIDAALMTVSTRYIPLDSRYEEMVEARLWQEKRAFIKPLRYDGEEDVFPDFMLTDVPGTDALPMEVFGMNTPEYLQRKRVKTAIYDREYGADNWWQWEASGDHEGHCMPAFPSKK